MSWNYRIIDHPDYTGIHEVYYDGDTPTMFSSAPDGVCCDLDEDIADVYRMMGEAFDKPALTEDDFEGLDLDKYGKIKEVM